MFLVFISFSPGKSVSENKKKICVFPTNLITFEKPDYHCALEQQFKIQVSCCSSVKKT